MTLPFLLIRTLRNVKNLYYFASACANLPPRPRNARKTVRTTLRTRAALTLFCLIMPPALADEKGAVAGVSASTPSKAAVAPLKRAVLNAERPSRDVLHILNWVTATSDSRGLPFVIIDKANAKVFVFDVHGVFLGAASALLGSARGDESIPGIGDKKLSDILPEEKTTPAGRFVAELGRNMNGEDILWVDYDAAVSLHRVRANNPRERRLERLASPTPNDNRISFGCINVPAHFYNAVVNPTFSRSKGIVYVLPETQPTHVVFGSFDAGTPQRR